MWLDQIPISLLNPPSRLRSLGCALMNGAGMLLIIGAVGQVAVAATTTVMTMAGGEPHITSLAQLYPELPTWWIPEGPLGCGFAAAVFLVGLVANTVAKKVHRLMY